MYRNVNAECDPDADADDDDIVGPDSIVVRGDSEYGIPADNNIVALVVLLRCTPKHDKAWQVLRVETHCKSSI
jgi:hypothetical protein